MRKTDAIKQHAEGCNGHKGGGIQAQFLIWVVLTWIKRNADSICFLPQRFKARDLSSLGNKLKLNPTTSSIGDW